MTLDVEVVARLMIDLVDHLARRVARRRDETPADELATVARVTTADTIYEIDRVGEHELLAWFDAAWPPEVGVELVAEGLETGSIRLGDRDPAWTVIVDPIDGTRMLMYDKRSAWSLAAAAPRGDTTPTLADIAVAAMVEIPTRKQQRADRLLAVRGDGVVADRVDRQSGQRSPLQPQPSAAVDLRHGFVSMARFFPDGRERLVEFEARLWHELYGDDPDGGWLQIFDDQYLATGGQCHQLATGADRMAADLRPLALENPSSVPCHPYDACTLLVASELGCQISDPWGAPLRAPLDETTPVSWVGYANAQLAQNVAPAFERALRACFD